MKKLSYMFSILFMLTIGVNTSAVAQQKKWSPQAKGAVIGGGSGAVLGAVIHKRNRAVGGVVGGVVGAGTGYVIGKSVDNKRKARAAQAEAARQSAYRASANRAAVAQRSASRTKESNAYKASAPVAPAMALTAASAAPTATANGYLPNDAANDPNNPYAHSEYKRKSW
jgi:hypothetical protein